MAATQIKSSSLFFVSDLGLEQGRAGWGGTMIIFEKRLLS
jgi:hypothetical protein